MSTSSNDTNLNTVKVKFIFYDSDTGADTQKYVDVAAGTTILEAARQNDIELEGACDGSLACSTCHVILDQTSFDKLDEPSDEENDMLDLAFGLTSNSRLGCQIILQPCLDGMEIKIPSRTRNLSKISVGVNSGL